jgi:hypothetical protein
MHAHGGGGRVLQRRAARRPREAGPGARQRARRRRELHEAARSRAVGAGVDDARVGDDEPADCSLEGARVVARNSTGNYPTLSGCQFTSRPLRTVGDGDAAHGDVERATGDGHSGGGVVERAGAGDAGAGAAGGNERGGAAEARHLLAVVILRRGDRGRPPRRAKRLRPEEAVSARGCLRGQTSNKVSPNGPRQHFSHTSSSPVGGVDGEAVRRGDATRQVVGAAAAVAGRRTGK